MMNFVKKHPLLTAFLIPFFICIIICIGNGVYPFGDYCLLHMDLYHQYLPFYNELWEKLRNGASLMYTWNIGLGSDFVSVFAYYLASPLNWLVVLFPKSHIIEFIELLIIFKISLSGATFFYFLKEHFVLLGKDNRYHDNTFVPAFVFSTAYALSGFVAAYSWDVMWMDVVAVAPLAIVGLEKLVRDKKPVLYYVSLALCILSNYYLSIMLCIFLVFWFAWLFFTQNGGKMAAIVRFAVYSLLAGGTAMVLIIPELIILSYSGSSGIEFPKQIEWYFNLLSEVGRMCTTASVYEGAENWPNLYAGAFSVMLLILFVLNKRINWKKKIAPVLFVLFFMASFANKQLDFIWHGLHFPDSLPGRQSYLYAFLVLTIGYATVRKWRGIRLWHIGVAVVFASALMAVSTMFADEDVTEYYAVIISILFVALYGIMTVLLKLAARKNRELLMVITCGIAIVELAVNMAVTGLGCTGRSSYNANVDDMQKALELAKEDAADNDVPFYRVEDTGRLTKNDGTRYGYASGTQFSSLMNINVSHFYQALYMEGGKNFYCYNGATPVTSAMLSVRYMVTKSIQPQNELTTLVGKCGNHYLYRNNYTLPLGFMMDEDVIDAWDYSDLDEIEAQNRLAELLGADEPMLTEIPSESVVGESTIDVQEDAYIFATYESTTVDSMTEEISDGRTKSFTKVSHGYTLDLGYCTAGTQVRIKNSNEERVNITAYALNLDAADTAYQTLNEQTMEMTSFSDTKITGTIDVKKEGRLIFAVADDAGWKLYVDGEQTDPEVFGEAFISTYLTEGTHTVELRYQTPGFMVGAGVSLACILIVILIAWIKRHH